MFSQLVLGNNQSQTKMNTKQVQVASVFQRLLTEQAIDGEIEFSDVLEEGSLVVEEENSLLMLLKEMPKSFFQHLLEDIEEISDLNLSSEEYVSLLEDLIDKELIDETVVWESFIVTLEQGLLGNEQAITISDMMQLLTAHDIEVDEERIEKLETKLSNVLLSKDVIKNIKSQLAINLKEISAQSKEQSMNNILLNLEDVNKKMTINNQEIEEKMGQILNHFGSMTENITSEEDIQRIAPKVLELLEEWNRLVRKADDSVLTQLEQNQKLSTKQRNIWESLLTTYGRRSQFAGNQQYNANAEVTSKDILKWLGQAFDAHSNSENKVNTAQHNPVHMTGLPMSKVEQFVIHLNQRQTINTPQVDKDLMNQFQNIMKSSRFFAGRNGVEQLSIRLRPDNLGEMMVRMTQVNGEMAVKIIVSSQAARSMLESNIHQLKHMFSPHQVVIEERQIMPNELENPAQDLYEEDKEQEHSDNEQEHKREEQSNESFEAYFEEVLMNERV